MLVGRVTLRNIFLVLFVASTLVLVILAVSTSMVKQAMSEFAPSANDDPSTTPPVQDADGLGFSAVIGSAITSITSLVGFIVTTVITWRKERRESSLAEVERKKLELELEKNRLELEELKRVKKAKKRKQE